MTPCLKWLLRARPADYMLALSVAGASLPVVGKHLEPLGGVTAMGVWGARHAPEFVSAAAKKDWLTPGINDVRRRDRESTREVSVAALRGVVSAADLDLEWPAAERTPPIWEALRAAPLPLPPRRSTTATTPRRCSTSGGARICRPNPRRC